MELRIANALEIMQALADLSDQGFLDVDPTETGTNYKPLYDFLVSADIAVRVPNPDGKYWLKETGGNVGEDRLLRLMQLWKTIMTPAQLSQFEISTRGGIV